MTMSNWPLARSISSDTLPFSLLLVSLRLSPRTCLSVTLSIPSSRTLARIAPATSPTPVTPRACNRSGTRIGQGDILPRPSARTSMKPVRSKAPADWSGDRHNWRCRTPRRASTPVARLRPLMLGNRAAGRSRSTPIRTSRYSLAPRSMAPRATARSDGVDSRTCPSSSRSLSVPVPATSISGLASRCSRPLRNGAGAIFPDNR